MRNVNVKNKKMVLVEKISLFISRFSFFIRIFASVIKR